MNILKKWRKRREEKRKLKQLKQTSSVFSTLERLLSVGLIYWDDKNRRMMIARPLALLMMRGADEWLAFMLNVQMWIYHRQCSDAWEAYIQKEELAAVRKALGDQSATLSREDIDRIKRARRQEIVESDMEPPKVEGFEFFVVDDTTDATPKMLVVGHYDPDTNKTEMATWEEVCGFLKNEN